MTTVDFTLPARLEASRPPEARGLGRDGVRLLVASRASGTISHRTFADLPEILRPGDVLVVNTSATLPAAVPVRLSPTGTGLVVHFSTRQTDHRWLVELRQARDKATEPYGDATTGQRYELRGGGAVVLREAYSRGRLWSADVDTGRLGVIQYLERHGDPIRYSYVPSAWPLPYYQTVFSTVPGSAEMPSAGRPFTDRIVTRLATAGVLVAPVLLHTGVASPEAHERPYPEWFAVSATTASVVNDARHRGGRVIAVGTTVVRALESAAQTTEAAEASGYTDLVITPERGVRLVDGLITGLHEPRASHLDMLAAIHDQTLLEASYAAAMSAGYLWHEFGDSHLLLP